MITETKPRDTVDPGIKEGLLSVFWEFRRKQETGSTNEDAFELGRAGSPAGIVCVAETQNRGRGRMNRSWFSPPGVGLYCSVLLRPSLPLQDAGLLSFCAALAMTDAVRAYGLEVSVKWPNDIVFNGRKICGILSGCEGVSGKLQFAVIGTGLNLLPGSYPETLRERAACLADFGIKPDREDLLHRYLDGLASNVEILEKEGFLPLRQRLEKCCVLLSEPVRITGNRILEGNAEGIGDHGELLLRTADGSLVPVTCGDVSLRGEKGYV